MFNRDGMKVSERWGAGMLLATTILLAGCVESADSDSATVTDANPTTVSGARIITGSIPGEYEYEYEDVAGTVTAVDGCVALELSDGAVYPIIWPLGYQYLPDEASVSSAHGTVALGEKLTESRGYLIDREVIDESPEPARLTGFDECDSNAPTFLVLVNVEDFDTPE
ncbi:MULTISPECIES: hypothetical protein [Cryobacterium]|uniref:hypothetical protein n=1 Tax=Cryobacterium TaxID=69578 RepID=UPI000CD40757|nr:MULTISPECIES: hypothetical protein [Cryobacterium]TFC45995.1 hypothetical protein E3O57_07475 [Cryobacterium sp. TMN-39-2]